MALTVTKHTDKVERVSRNYGMLTGTIDFDASYPTGGESCTGISAYFKSLKVLLCENKSGHMFEYDATNNKLKALKPVDVTIGSETAGANNTICKTSTTGPIEVSGTGTAFQVAGAEVLDTTDLSALTGIRFVAFGLI